MSHLTVIKTSFQNLSYLEKALNKLDIAHQKTEVNNNETHNENLIISQSNGHDIEFSWNGEGYELMIDQSFWQQTFSVTSFIDKLTQQYVGEVIMGESQKIGFQPVKCQSNIDGSNTVVVQRWNNSQSYTKN